MHYCILVNKQQCVMIFSLSHVNIILTVIKKSKYFFISDAEILKQVESQEKKRN